MAYPASVQVETPEKIARWRPLVHGLMAIPHFIIMSILSMVGGVVAVISWFAIVFTGKLPEGLANFQCMVLRYTIRVGAYVAFLYEDYPPFEFATTPADPGTSPVRVELQPSLDDRNRLTVALRYFWMIPAAIVTMLIGFIAYVCVVIGFFAVLFTGKWPEGLRAWVMKAIRANVRLSAYAYLLTDEYPPMTFDDIEEGPSAPAAVTPTPPPGGDVPPPPPPPPPPAPPA